MRFTKLKLVGYSRLLLSNIRTFTYTPSLPIQSVLGTNGSGKSSLLGELTPLPPDPDDYSKDGMKDIEFTHDGNFYRVVSKFSPKTLHTLYINGTIHHDNVNTSVLRDTCKQLFKITPEIHELLLGTDSSVMFHAMSAPDRRKWFTLFSPTSYEYAIGLHKRTHKRANEYESAIKLDRRSLVGEDAKVISPAEEARLQGEVTALHQELKRLYALQAPIERNAEEILTHSEKLSKELVGISNLLMQSRLETPLGNPFHQERDDWGMLEPMPIRSLEELNEVLARLRTDVGATEAVLNQLVKTHEELDKKHAILKKAEEDGLSNFAEKIAGFNVEINQILSQRRLKLDFEDAAAALRALRTVQPILANCFADLPSNADRRFGREPMRKRREELLASQDKVLKLQGKFDALREKHLHLEAHKQNAGQECPSCHHRWVSGYDAKIHGLIKEELETVGEALKAAQAEVELGKERIAEMDAYFLLYREYTTCVASTPSLQPFWDHIAAQEYPTDSPRAVPREATFLEEDLQRSIQAEEIIRRKAELSSLQQSAAVFGSANLEEVKGQLQASDTAIGETTFKLKQLRRQLEEYGQYWRDLVNAMQLGEEVERLQNQLLSVTDELVESLRREAIQVCIRQTQSQLARKEDLLAGIQAQKNIVLDLQSRIEEREQDGAVWRLVEKAMSPKDGLIADGLYGSIRNSVAQMNAFIKRVWSYPLVIEPCGIAGDTGAELDYIFPLLVDGKRRKDVKKGSRGMHEIVNLAFKVMGMKYLGLTDWPLFLDEFAANLDKEHRFAAGAVIASLMESGQYPQLFMVSHYVEGYGAFPNSEVCVLDSRNIVVPAHYNQHVTFE